MTLHSHCRKGHPLTDDNVLIQGGGRRCKLCNLEYRANFDHRAWSLLYNTGLTRVRYDELLAAQNGGCAACGATEPGGQGEFHVDHDHSCCPPRKVSGVVPCGKCVRGLLCSACNLASGLLQDDPTRLRALADYLERRR